MVILAIALGVVLPIMVLYYCIEDFKSYFNSLKVKEEIEKMEKELEEKYGKLKR